MIPQKSRYTRFVRVMRLALPFGAAALVAALVLWPRLQGLDRDFVLPEVDETVIEKDGRVRLDNPRYVGEASAEGAYRVEAEAARLDPTSPRHVELEHMRAELPTPERRDVEVEAARALYDRDRETIDLDGGIEVATSDGYRLRTDAATVAIAAGSLVTRGPIDGLGPQGTISAERLEVEKRGEVLRFSGDVRVNLRTATATEDGS